MERCTRRDIGGVVEVGVAAACSLQVCAALILANAGNLPVVEYAFHQLVLAVEIGELVDVSEVENMRAVVGKRAVVVFEIGRIAEVSAAAILAANTQRLTKSVVSHVGEAACLLIPRHLQAVVVRVHLVIEDLQVPP